ncbi:hypothetical protein [Mesorhizobium argentiipisi]|uniref:Uncharacterized protein n=1 Tax=Mesorhizobium argentiipisi TaxID=3015175 RepID=A0ABU8KI93_9HYPH
MRASSFFDFPSETNFTDSDSNWVFGAVNKHLRRRRLRGTVFLGEGGGVTLKQARPATSSGLLSRLRSCIATEYVHLE